MKSRNLFIIGGAVLIGLFAVLIVNGVFSGVEKRQAEVAEQNRMVRLVVASQELDFGAPLSSQNVRLVNWPANSVPEGAFTSLEEATRSRVALRPIVAGEPILTSKVSGQNGRATLSANLPVGQVAFAIPISEITGAGGFVRPGDVVDVLVTRKIPGNGASESDKMTDVVLEAVPVLGIDQESNQNKTAPSVGKTATLQVDTVGAQKLALAQQLGVLTLALRNVTDQNTGLRNTVIGRDITASSFYIPQRSGGAPSPVAPRPYTPVALRAPPRVQGAIPAPRVGPTMIIVRGTKPTEEGIRYGD
jgi:pilus assembly protein CpaB